MDREINTESNANDQYSAGDGVNVETPKVNDAGNICKRDENAQDDKTRAKKVRQEAKGGNGNG